MIGDAGDDVCEPRLGIDAVEASGFDERVHDGGSAAAVVGAGEQIVLSPQGERDRSARVERQAAALRENLRKRKAQSRARAERPPEREETKAE